MKKNTSTQEERERSCLNEHERLATLFQKDRLSFERERRRLIKENIAAWPNEKSKEKLILLQQRWDRVLRGAGSKHNRFTMMQALFWDHIVNDWLPNLDKFKR